jgi:hypothetical protein
MVETIFKFQHDSNVIPTALGLPEEVHDRCKEIIFFSTFTNHFIKKDFFDNDADTPSTLTTITGVLEKALSLSTSESEKLYLLFIFKEVHEKGAHNLMGYQMIEEETDEKAKKKMKMLLELTELKALMSDDDRSELTTPKDMFKRIDIAKKNMYNFENYFNEVMHNEPKN